MKSDRRLAIIIACLCLLFVVAPGSLVVAQVTTGTILGVVKDQSEAVLPGATVTITNVETGTSRTTTTGSRGEYRVPALAAGTYELQASLAGFQTSVRRGITLNVGRDAVVDFLLPVGNVAERVTVTGEAPIIETTTATVSALIDPTRMRAIPLNARSFIDLVPSQGGAVFAESGERSATKGFGRKLAIGGQRYASNSFLLDGADINDAAGSAGSAAGTLAGMETVREFRVVVNAYDAEYGRHTGGVISAITKSGTNEFHGSVFEFLRNDNLDARNFFDRDPDNPLERSNPPEFRRNQFGFSFGGPVRRDRLFFFSSFEALRERLGVTNTSDVPGIGMRNGFLPPRPGQPAQFVGVSPVIKPFLDAYPVPNTPDFPDGRAQYVASFSRPTNQNYGTARADYRFSDSDSLFGRFTIDNAEQSKPQENGFNTSEAAGTASRYVTLEETHILSPQRLARTHFSFSRTNLTLGDIPLAGFTFPRLSFSDETSIPGIISGTGTGLSGWGGSNTNPKKHVQNTFQFKEDMYWTTGRHSVKFGGQFERFQFNQRSDFYPGGQFEFATLTDFLTNTVSAARFIRPGSDDIRGWRENVIGLYLHDDIAVRPGLTLNLGLRYEFITVPTEANGKVATVRDLRPAHITTVTEFQTDVGDPYFRNPSLRNFAPRIGLAWTPFSGGKTSVRAGFGLFHDQILPNAYITSGVRMAPFFSVSELFRETTPVAIEFPNAFFSQRDLLVRNVGSRPQADGFEWNVHQPAVYKWSFDVEQQILADMSVGAGYTGTRGTHLVRGALMLNVTPSEFRDGRRYILIDRDLPNPNWNRMRWRMTDASSEYHALRLNLNKRFSGGLQVNGSYTFSKSTDDSSTWTGSTDFNEGDRRGYMLEKDHALSAFDVRHSFYTSVVYELPWRNLTGAAGHLLGGWSVGSGARINSGNPFNIQADQPRLSRGGQTFQMRFVEGATLDVIPGGSTNPVRPQNADEYFDVNQFSYPTPFFLGNLGRNTVITPGVANVDVSLMKETKLPWLGENKTLQFRAEFFNLFNRPNFAPPSARNLFDRNGNRRSNAGQITDTRTSSRQIQLALRLAF